ncbi:hypothetical protein EDD18DRAFT_1356552 [Armillaria luteobubalina]|uniref:Uncharacterized protein n=1 Tax=Armillaria luteobubalina TaxID=153913 RepID=A0AA39Q2I6_9AGAR|nr:hypothetical protein EDD18DRAFT_1356552 [Armillaria luteobubalina]
MAADRTRSRRAWKIVKHELLYRIIGRSKDAIRWHEMNLDYNVPGGTLNRSMSLVDAAEIIKGTSLTDDEHLKSAVLGRGSKLVSPAFCIFAFWCSRPSTRSSKPSSSSQTACQTHGLRAKCHDDTTATGGGPSTTFGSTLVGTARFLEPFFFSDPRIQGVDESMTQEKGAGTLSSNQTMSVWIIAILALDSTTA